MSNTTNVDSMLGQRQSWTIMNNSYIFMVFGYTLTYKAVDFKKNDPHL